jgi:protein-disulfide isomerase
MHKGTLLKYLGGSFIVVLSTAMLIAAPSQGFAEQKPITKPSPQTKPAPSLQTQSPSKPSLSNFIGREVRLGNPHAPLTIVMYYSLTCPHCHEYQKDELPKIQKEYIDKGLVQFIFRDFPTDSTAVKAAKIAWCHGIKEYLAFSRKLLETQDKWVPIDMEKIKEAEKAFHDIATHELGISENDYQKCLVNENIEASILRQSFEAQKVYEINAAPAFLINNKYFDGIVTTDTIQKHLLEMGIH